jgi:oxygen-dependent protoporphyrinogen oxidase
VKARVAIVGGGITGLAAATWLRHDHDIENVVVLETSHRPGGKVRTELDHGHTLESGPQGFLDNAPDTIELAGICGLEGALVRADDGAADRFILRDGSLRRVATSPLAFMFSDILPLAGRLRLLGEPFARRRPDHDETVFDFAHRRIGRRAAEVLVDAMVTGVFAGDSQKLSLAATFPRMAAMEADHGSLTRAMIAKMREARRAGGKSGGPAGPGGTLTTFEGGMERLPQHLAGRLGDRLRLGTPVHEIRRNAGGGFTLTSGAGDFDADEVLLSVPAHYAADLLRQLAPKAVPALDAIPTAPIAVVMMAYQDAGAFNRPVHGFGFLVPRGEEPSLLGTLFCHDIFRGQAPPGQLFLRVMAGGSRMPEAIELDDNALLTRIRGALARVLGADPEPDHTWIVRWERGISQYTVGHLDRVSAAEQAAGDAGIELAGSPYRGVSVNDCIKSGCWMLDAGCWMLDAGCWMLDAGCWMLDAGCDKAINSDR